MKLHPYHRNRLLLLTGVAGSALLFWLVGRLFDVPYFAGFNASLILQPSPVAALLVTGVALLAATAIGTAVAGTLRFDAGLFCAAAGLTVLTLRGGPMRYALLQDGSARGAFLLMAVEVLVLFGFLGACWWGLWQLHRRGRLQPDSLRDGLADNAAVARVDQWYATGIQVAVMTLLMMLLAQTDEKKQVLAAVGISSMIGTSAAYAFAPVRPSVWFWAGPAVVGAFGYLWTYLNWKTGTGTLADVGPTAPDHTFAALARALPLDYASVGTACAILGYWMARRSRRAKELAAIEQQGTQGGTATTA